MWTPPASAKTVIAVRRAAVWLLGLRLPALRLRLADCDLPGGVGVAGSAAGTGTILGPRVTSVSRTRPAPSGVSTRRVKRICRCCR